MQKVLSIFGAIAVAVSTASCGRSGNPTSNPIAPVPGQVTATLSPASIPVQVQTVPGSSAVRYVMNVGVTFHDGTGLGGRITQVTLTVVNGQATAKSMPLSVTLPPGGTVTQQISYSVDGVAGQVPSRLQVTATGVDPTGKTFAVPTVEAPLTVAGPAASAPFGHVFVVVEENKRYEDVIGNPAMPYLNSLARQYASAAQYYGNTHPSIGNYFMMTVGNIVSNSDSFSGTVTDDNIVRQLIAAGLTWKSYAEDLPSVGYTGGDAGSYARRHNVFAFLTDVVGSSTQVRNLVPFQQFFADMAANAFPNYSFIVPNLCNDGHDCPLSTVDAWLQSNVSPLLGNSQFQRDGLLLILFDESVDADTTNGGGHIPWVAVSSKAKRGYTSNIMYQHQSTLRLTVEALGLTGFPNQAAGAPDMHEFFIY